VERCEDALPARGASSVSPARSSRVPDPEFREFNVTSADSRRLATDVMSRARIRPVASDIFFRCLRHACPDLDVTTSRGVTTRMWNRSVGFTGRRGDHGSRWHGDHGRRRYDEAVGLLLWSRDIRAPCRVSRCWAGVRRPGPHARPPSRLGRAVRARRAARTPHATADPLRVRPVSYPPRRSFPARRGTPARTGPPGSRSPRRRLPGSSRRA
jgi:hypothetical protein